MLRRCPVECPVCAAENPEGSVYCCKCGRRVGMSLRYHRLSSLAHLARPLTGAIVGIAIGLYTITVGHAEAEGVILLMGCVILVVGIVGLWFFWRQLQREHGSF